MHLQVFDRRLPRLCVSLSCRHLATSNGSVVASKDILRQIDTLGGLADATRSHVEDLFVSFTGTWYTGKEKKKGSVTQCHRGNASLAQRRMLEYTKQVFDVTAYDPSSRHNDTPTPYKSPGKHEIKKNGFSSVRVNVPRIIMHGSSTFTSRSGSQVGFRSCTTEHD